MLQLRAISAISVVGDLAKAITDLSLENWWKIRSQTKLQQESHFFIYSNFCYYKYLKQKLWAREIDG